MVDEDELDASFTTDETIPADNTVLEVLPRPGLAPYPDIAEMLDVLPWDVLTVCRRLVRMGLAREGKGKERGSFGRA